mgnify:CR=1 FL=1
MLNDPEEAIYVKDGALMALGCAFPETILKDLPLVTPFAKVMTSVKVTPITSPPLTVTETQVSPGPASSLVSAPVLACRIQVRRPPTSAERGPKLRLTEP